MNIVELAIMVVVIGGLALWAGMEIAEWIGLDDWVLVADDGRFFGTSGDWVTSLPLAMVMTRAQAEAMRPLGTPRRRLEIVLSPGRPTGSV